MASSQWACTCGGCETVHPHHSPYRRSLCSQRSSRRKTLLWLKTLRLPYTVLRINSKLSLWSVSPPPLVPACFQPRLRPSLPRLLVSAVTCRERWPGSLQGLHLWALPPQRATLGPVFLDCILSLCCNLRHGPFLVIYRDLPLLAMLHTNLD